MHNLHFIVVKAESGEEACDVAESLISDFGDENSWRTMCGAVSQDNEVYDANDGRYPPDEESDTIEKINAMVQGWIDGNDVYSSAALDALEVGKSTDEMTSQELWSMREHYNHLFHRKLAYEQTDGQTFDVLKHSFNDFQIDDCGVTQSEEEGEGKLWVVFCDMHS